MQKKAATTSTSKSGAKTEPQGSGQGPLEHRQGPSGQTPVAKAAGTEAHGDVSDGVDQAAAGADKAARGQGGRRSAKAKPKGDRAEFLDRQRQLLLDERANYSARPRP